ncbi:MYND-type domain-containing protein [Mycena chlorophos]|uniref:MYND-type domain-containing protein n=1 Tax=Mycena chlorophos TaxID=658473 RepID=A0A8H6TIY5_MYCCL|nr:MYND-type domain-containing protein [Mycena chlorophos]
MNAPLETLPNAQAAIDEFLDVLKGSKAYVCSQCAASSSATVTLKLCGGCQLTRYCSKSCQVDHWKTHKLSCKNGPADLPRNVPHEHRAQVFVKNLLRVSWIMILLDLYAVVALNLTRDPTNANRLCILSRITTVPVSSDALVKSKSSSKPQTVKKPDNPLVMLQFESFRVLPISRMTQTMHLTLETARKRYIGSGIVGPETPFISMFFSTDGDNFIYEPHPLHPMLLQLARVSASGAPGSLPLFDDGEPVSEAKVVKELNDFIRLDKENLGKARGPLYRREK